MAKIYNVHDAKSNFSRLLEEVSSGNRVIIARAGVPVAELVPHTVTTRPAPGFLKHLLEVEPGFDEAKFFSKAPYESRLDDDIFDVPHEVPSK
jgi:prevent-host-death family protein